MLHQSWSRSLLEKCSNQCKHSEIDEIKAIEFALARYHIPAMFESSFIRPFRDKVSRPLSAGGLFERKSVPCFLCLLIFSHM